MPTESAGKITTADTLTVGGDIITVQPGGSETSAAAAGKNPLADAVEKLATPWTIIILAGAIVAVVYLSKRVK